MKPFSNRRTKRNTTFVAMLVWAFALAFGMANACLLETPGQHAHIDAGRSANARHVHASDATPGDVLAVDDDHDDDADASKDSYLKACDDGSSAQVKVQTGVKLTDPGLALLLAFAWNAATPVASAPSRFDELLVPVNACIRFGSAPRCGDRSRQQAIHRCLAATARLSKSTHRIRNFQ